MGRKVWTRERLTSADVQAFLMDQALIRFPSAATRTADWPNPPEGALTYLEDVKRHDERRGGAWVPLAGGARGQIARASLALTTNSGINGQSATWGQTLAASTRAGERIEHRITGAVYSPNFAQTLTLTLARFTPAVGGRVVVGSRKVVFGGTLPDDFAPIEFFAEETPPAGDWLWRLEASSNGANAAVIPADIAPGAAHTVNVVART